MSEQKTECETRECKECAQEKPLIEFGAQQVIRRGQVFTYHRHMCRPCYAASAYTKTGGFDNKLTEEEKVSLRKNKEFYETDNLTAFHRRCKLKMKLEAFRRFNKLGKVAAFLVEFEEVPIAEKVE